MFNRTIYGIDLGTSSVKIYGLRKNRLMVEKDMIAIMNKTQVIAVGNDAYEMYEKTPPNIRVDTPVVNGKIADVDEVEMLLQVLLKKHDRRGGRAPIIYFSAPTNMSEIEKRAYYMISHTGEIRSPKVFLVDRPICDAVSLGIPLSRTKGSMIINLGAQNTEVSVIANEQVIISTDISVGGQHISDAISNEIRRQSNLLIGKRTADRLKSALATLTKEKTEARKVVGLNTLSGLPREGIISSALVSKAMESVVAQEAEEIRKLLERTPPQIARFIREEGVFLTGGTARIPGIDQYISKVINCNVNISPDYELSTIKGLEEIIKNKEHHKWAYSIRKKK